MKRLNSWDEVRAAIVATTTLDELDEVCRTNIVLCEYNKYEYSKTTFYQRKKIIINTLKNEHDE